MVGSSAALLLVVVLYFYLPESIKFLVLRKRNRLSVRGCHRAPDAIALELNADGFHSRLLGARNSARPQRVSGLIYPTAIRSLGAGWMHGIGRFGAIAAPLIGGWLISLHFSQQTLFSARLCRCRSAHLRLLGSPAFAWHGSRDIVSMRLQPRNRSEQLGPPA